MGKLLGIYMLDEVSFIRLLNIFKIGYIHPEDTPGTVRGFMFGIWRLEVQLILGFWDKSKQTAEGVANA